MILALCTLLAAETAFGQQQGQQGQQVRQHEVPPAATLAGGQLTRAGFGKFSIGGQKFPFRDADRYVDDRLTAHLLRSGAMQERVALGLGVSGAALVGTGFILCFGGDLDTDIIGYVSWGVGGALGLAAIVLGANGSAVLRRAMRDYNARNHTSLGLTLAPTQGGVGLQLVF